LGGKVEVLFISLFFKFQNEKMYNAGEKSVSLMLFLLALQKTSSMLSAFMPVTFKPLPKIERKIKSKADNIENQRSELPSLDGEDVIDFNRNVSNNNPSNQKNFGGFDNSNNMPSVSNSLADEEPVAHLPPTVTIVPKYPILPFRIVDEINQGFCSYL
jgi:hypothetical protein